MIAEITAGVTQAITYIGQVLTAIVGENGAFNAVLPIIGLFIGVYIVGIGVSFVRRLIKGY